MFELEIRLIDGDELWGRLIEGDELNFDKSFLHFNVRKKYM